MTGALTGGVYVAFFFWNLHGLSRDWAKHLDAEAAAPLWPLLLALRIVLLGLGAWSGFRLARAGLHRQALPRALRTLFYCAFASILLSNGASLFLPESPRWPHKSIFFSGLAFAQLLWALRWVRTAGGVPRAPSRGATFADLACANVLALLIVVELVLVVWAWRWPSALVFSDGPSDAIRAHRLAPHAPFFGGRLNQEGYADDDFFTAKDDDLVIAVVGDSFGVGVVPVPYHYVSVAEKALQGKRADRAGRVALHNYGVPSIGIAEYAALLHTEILQRKPTLVVVSLFVGNDLYGGNAFDPSPRRRHRLDQWLLWQVSERVLALLSTDADDVARLTTLGTTPNTPGGVPPWVSDPRLEEATFSEDRFLAIERERRAITDIDARGSRKAYRRLFAGLHHFERVLGDALVVAIIPDEFQVNDRLWQTIGGDTVGLDRDLPQKKILAVCKDRGILCVDFLPELREAETEGRTYHLRDTHWNVRGNRVAGLELARVLGERLERQ